MKHPLTLLYCMLALASCGQQTKPTPTSAMTTDNEHWKKVLTKEQYEVTCNEATEAAFTGKYWDHHADGSYNCVRCGTKLFGSETKFDSGSGWPSYYSPADKANIKEVIDKSYGMMRTEVRCAKCDAHLGHLFNDGPQPTGMRYCINSASLNFSEKK